MNENTCRKAFIEENTKSIGMYDMDGIDFQSSIPVLNISTHERAYWFYIGFKSAWNLKPKLSVEDLMEIITELGEDKTEHTYAELAQAIYDKQESKINETPT